MAAIGFTEELVVAAESGWWFPGVSININCVTLRALSIDYWVIHHCGFGDWNWKTVSVSEGWVPQRA